MGNGYEETVSKNPYGYGVGLKIGNTLFSAYGDEEKINQLIKAAFEK